MRDCAGLDLGVESSTLALSLVRQDEAVGLA